MRKEQETISQERAGRAGSAGAVGGTETGDEQAAGAGGEAATTGQGEDGSGAGAEGEGEEGQVRKARVRKVKAAPATNRAARAPVNNRVLVNKVAAAALVEEDPRVVAARAASRATFPTVGTTTSWRASCARPR